MRLFQLCIISLVLSFPIESLSQDISLYGQYNGRYDYLAIGNTLNLQPNGPFITCDILTSSSATLNLNSSQNIIAAFLYWAGSGTGDFDILFNNIPISAERVFSNTSFNGRLYFAAFADVTTVIQNQRNALYTVSELDLTDVIPSYCGTGSNFGGWALAVIYEDNDLPLNQLNVYDGLQSVPDEITIALENLNVLDNAGAKIGFIAWEGDATIAVNETLSINGNPISNPPLNPTDNAFNGTNSFTGSTDLYNMDIDVYNIQNNINIGDTTATIELTSDQDFVMINNIITVLNSQLPDATVSLNDYSERCEDGNLELNYTVFNTNSTDILPADTPIAFYINGQLAAQSETQNDIAINGFENGSILLTVPNAIIDGFELSIIVDDNGLQSGSITETDETNNDYNESIVLNPIPEIRQLPTLVKCNEGFNAAVFNLTDLLSTSIDPSTIIGYYENLTDLENEENDLSFPEDYLNSNNPQTIYIKTTGVPCFNIYQAEISVKNCPPFVPDGFSPNNDGINDWFNIQGLYDIFIDHQLLIYNRYGTLIFEGDNSKFWDGKANRGLNNIGTILPTGTYFYILYLNDPNYTPINGWVYINY